jgi:uncharacterized protein YegJ (DUF2314 family)
MITDGDHARTLKRFIHGAIPTVMDLTDHDRLEQSMCQHFWLTDIMHNLTGYYTGYYSGDICA